MASAAAPATADVLARPPARILREALGDRVLDVTDFRGDLAIRVERSAWFEAARLLRHHPELDFALFLDLCAVDHLGRDEAPERFEVVLHLYSVSKKHHVRLKTAVPESDPKLATISPLFLGANWFEREAWDLYGIVFEGHPNLTRLLTHDDFVGHPMRKDYPVGQRHPLRDAAREAARASPEGSEQIVVNIGPSHPAMHGTFRVQALLDGETITDAEAEIGYLHRNFEKMAENRCYWQIIPYTDRLNYCSSFMNGHGWALAVEKLLGVQAPPRAEAIRVILSEFSRIMDHIVCITANVVDLGAITPFFVMFRAREAVYDLLEACCGARLTVSYVRIGGLAEDVPADFADLCRAALASCRQSWQDAHQLLTRNRDLRPALPRRGRDVEGGRALLGLGGAVPARLGCRATTSARITPTPATSSTTSTSRSAPSATATTATSCAWRRCARACGSSSRRSRSCRAGRSSPTTEAWRCRRRPGSTRTSRTS